MNPQIIGLAPGQTPTLEAWLAPSHQSPSAAAVSAWAQQQCRYALSDIFGYHALQLGAASLPTLSNSRITHRWLALDTANAAPAPTAGTAPVQANLLANACALPFFEATLDLVTLPFTLDAHSDPQRVLAEVARVLVPQGHALFIGFEKTSLWGLAHQLKVKNLPQGLQLYGLRRLKRALAQLGLAPIAIERCRQLSTSAPPRTLRCSWHGVYILVAQKRVLPLKPIYTKPWKSLSGSGAAASNKA